MSKPLYELPENCDFINDDETACAPQLIPKYGNRFRGILINGPKLVTWPKDDSPKNYLKGPFGETLRGPFRSNVVILYRLPHSTLALKGDFQHEILIVAVNQNTQQAYSGKLRKVGSAYVPPDDLNPSIAKHLGNTIKSSSFKISLLDDLKVPITNATYTVYATLGEYKSNVITIQTVVK